MQDAGSRSGDAPSRSFAVSPNNPCPFLRALVAEGFVDGHTVPLSTLSRTIKAASGERGLNERLAGLKTYLVALIANGFNPCACCVAAGPEHKSMNCATARWTSTAAVHASSTRPLTLTRPSLHVSQSLEKTGRIHPVDWNAD